MKLKLLILLAVVIVIRCTCGGDVAGTGDVVNTGSIFGKLLTEEGDTIDDTVTVSLYRMDEPDEDVAKRAADDNEPLETLTSTDGSYEFDSLAEGEYSVVVTKDEIIVGGEDGISLEEKEVKEIDITIVIIINQTFNIWNTDNSQEITINNFTIENGTIKEVDSGNGYILTAVESDTLVFEIEIIRDGDTSTVTVRIIRHDDGSSTFEIIEQEDDEVEVTFTPGTGPAEGFLGTITIDVKEPGSTGVKGTFDTSDIPEKSR